jgi:hypothetical protein
MAPYVHAHIHFQLGVAEITIPVSTASGLPVSTHRYTFCRTNLLCVHLNCTGYQKARTGATPYPYVGGLSRTDSISRVQLASMRMACIYVPYTIARWVLSTGSSTHDGVFAWRGHAACLMATARCFSHADMVGGGVCMRTRQPIRSI